MRLVARLLLAALCGSGFCASLSAQAGGASNVVFTMNGGDFVSSGPTSETLTLDGATLVGVQGLAGFGIPNSTVTPPLSLGSVTLTTTILQSGGTFTDKFSDGLVFTGTFSNSSFNPKAGATNTWLFIGDVNGTLTVPGYIPEERAGVHVTFLNVTGPTNCTAGGGCTYAAGQGTTTIEFVQPLTPVPEPGTLTLFGCGMAVLVLMRRRRLGVFSEWNLTAMSNGGR